jgi:hypothetical protein
LELCACAVVFLLLKTSLPFCRTIVHKPVDPTRFAKARSEGMYSALDTNGNTRSEQARMCSCIRPDSADVPGLAQIQRFRGSILPDLEMLTQALTKIESG